MTLNPRDNVATGPSGLNKTIVFLHNFGGASGCWSWVIDALPPACNFIAFDLPGFGNEAAQENPTIENFSTFAWNKIADLDLQHFMLVGHDMGAKIALQMAIDDKKGQIEHLIMVAPVLTAPDSLTATEKQKMLIHPDLEQANRAVKKSRILPLTNEQFSLAIHEQMVADHKTWVWWLEQGINQPLSDQVSKLRLPVTIVASKDDPEVSFGSIMKFQFIFLAHAKLISLAGTGHLIPLEAPEWLAGQLKDIMALPVLKES